MRAHSFLLSKVKAVAILTVEHSDGRRLQQKVKGRCRVAASEAAKAVYIKTLSEKFKNRSHQSSSIIGAKLKVLPKKSIDNYLIPKSFRNYCNSNSNLGLEMQKYSTQPI